MSISESSPIYRLPPEILIVIFSKFSWDGSEPFVPATKDNPWFQHVRMLKALILVSRLWYGIAAPMLYSFVYLRHLSQLESLVKTLDDALSAKSDISHWVEHIKCEVFVPLGWEDIYRDNIVRLITHCGGIRKLGHAPIFDEQITNPLDLALLRHLPSSNPLPDLLELKIGEHVLTTGPLLRLPLSCFTQLKKLHLEVDSGAFESATQNPAILPNLETLICEVSSNRAYNNVGAIAGHWLCPKLRNLTIRTTNSDWDNVSFLPVKTLCAAYGAHLSYLCMHTQWTKFSEGLSDIYNLCPNLDHISYSYDQIPILATTLSGSTPTGSSLRRVSLLPRYCPFADPDDKLEEHLSDLTQRSLFPSLGTIIILDPRLRGDVVDGRYLPDRYANILRDWSSQLRTLRIRFLNDESQPVNVALRPEISEVDDGSDNEYEPDSEDSESGSDQSDFDGDNNDDGSSPKTSNDCVRAAWTQSR